MTSPPGITIERPALVLCAIHGAHLRPLWPQGYLPIGLALMKRFLADPEVHELSRGKVEHLDGLLPEFAPLCDRYRGELVKAYEESGLGSVAECSACETEALGTKVLANVYRKGEASLEENHVCFACSIVAPCQSGQKT